MLDAHLGTVATLALATIMALFATAAVLGQHHTRTTVRRWLAQTRTAARHADPTLAADAHRYAEAEARRLWLLPLADVDRELLDRGPMYLFLPAAPGPNGDGGHHDLALSSPVQRAEGPRPVR